VPDSSQFYRDEWAAAAGCPLGFDLNYPWKGWWPRSHEGSYQVEGAPEPALSLPKGPWVLGTGEVERIHWGSCQPLIRAVRCDSISTVPRAVRLATLRAASFNCCFVGGFPRTAPSARAFGVVLGYCLSPLRG